MMSQQAKDATCKAIVGKIVESMEWSPSDGNGGGYWVITFSDSSEICFNRMMAEVV